MFRGLITIWCSIHIFLGFLFAVIIGKFVTYYIFTAPTVKELIQLSKCPACFGVNICPEFMKHQININGFSLYTTVVNKFGPGNIFYGLYEDQRVVLKKLGNIWEVNEVDKKICLHIGLSPDCNVGNTLWHPEDFYETVKQLLTLPVIQSDGQIEFNKFHVCPSTENLELLLHRYYHINKSINRKILSINIWFMVLLNPEPLILQTILKEDDSPIPKYYGACGRVVVEEYVGDTLTYFYNSPWLKRVHITYQLLMAATYFTERHPYFNFYLTDISPDNIAVNDAGIIKFIDLENVIVVDRTVTNIVDKYPDWYTPHVTDNIECVDCYHFSAHDICSHNISDHNYYVICQHILDPDTSSDLLPGGLLHDIPSHIHKSYPELVKLIHSCVQPELQNDRFSIVHRLKHILSEILKVS